MNLAEGSKSYHKEADIYERFSQVEDTPEKILQFFKLVVKDETVLDLGCGTGKYARLLSPLTKKYYGIDISADQLKIAKDKNPDVEFICNSAEKINLLSETIDTIISTWVIGTVNGYKRKAQVISEALRVLKPNGKIYLIENDIGGDFETIRGRYPNISRTKEYNDWLENEMKFKPVSRFTTYFDFSSIQEAKQIMGSIWGKDASDNVQSKKINQNIIIYAKNKLV
ncbi:MAG: class I SAM-dependent methyltransferase [Candidatus Woesearchaeota archaeon]